MLTQPMANESRIYMDQLIRQAKGIKYSHTTPLMSRLGRATKPDLDAVPRRRRHNFSNLYSTGDGRGETLLRCRRIRLGIRLRNTGRCRHHLDRISHRFLGDVKEGAVAHARLPWRVTVLLRTEAQDDEHDGIPKE